MLLKDKIGTNEQKYWEYAGYAIALLFVLTFLYLFLRILVPLAAPAPPNSVFCDAEVRQGEYFLTDKNTFDNGKTQSLEEALSGRFSSKVDTINRIGFSYKMRFPKEGDRYRVSVWRYKMNIAGGSLVIAAPEKVDFYKEENLAIESKNGWEKIEIIFNVPPEKGLEYLNIYATSNTAEPVYFDDLLIQKIEAPKIVNPYNPPVVNLEIGEEWLDELKVRRANAISTGILIEEEAEWTKGRILQADEEIPLDLRLKGDWLDHLRTDKWAFRVKTKSSYSWKGMQRFTLETPSVKNFLREWIFHEFLHQEDIIAPRYDFVRVNINNKNAGIYAYEEHFDRPLLEFNQRENGPILKFSDEAYWLNLRREISGYGEKGNRQFIQNFDVSQVQPFGMQIAQTDVEFTKEFNIAKDLMNQYKYNLRPADEIFDIDKMAKFYAITDVLQAYHGIIWHNQRFYYNPKTGKIEPIGFDGFGAKIKSWQDKPFIGYQVYNQEFEDDGLYVNLFKNEAFMEAYLAYLYKYTDYEFLANILANLESDLRQREMFIQRETSSYSFDEKDILDNARHIRSYLTPFNNLSIQAYKQGVQSNAQQVAITNYHSIALEIIGFGINANTKKIQDPLKTPKLLPINLPNQLPNYITYNVSRDITHVFYRIPNTDSMFFSMIVPWASARTQTPEQELFTNIQLRSNNIYTVSNKNILFVKGNHTVSSNIVIPQGYKVNFQAGTKLNFVNKAIFISKSPVYMPGKSSETIEITSSDNSGNGFSIIQAKGKSQLSYVNFSNFNTLTYKGWELSGSVTFYEADVLIENCIFSNNNATSALNIVRSNFDVSRSTFSKNKRQNIDVAYSNGTIAYSIFNNTGGSAIDIKNGKITIKEVSIMNTAESAIIAGERSIVNIFAAKIQKASTAVSSKDYSKVFIDFIDIKDCQTGFAIFKSKPELGGSQIIVKDYKIFNYNRLHLIDFGSTLQLKEKIIKGN